MPRKKRGGDATKAPPVLLAAVIGAAAAVVAVRVRRGAVASDDTPVTPGRVAVPRLPLAKARELIARGEPVVVTDLRTPAAANWSMAYLEDAFRAHEPVVMTVATDLASRCCRYYEPRREAIRRGYPYPFKPKTRLYKDTFAGFAETLRSENRTTLHYLHDVFFGDAAPAWLTPPKIASDMQRTAEALGAAATAVPGFDRFAHGKLWIGMKGVVMPLHYDSTDNFYVPFFGRKKVVLVEPGHVEELGRFPNGHPLAGSARADVDLDVLDDLQIFETVIAPGDVLYLPANWWHQFEQPFEDTGALNFWTPPRDETEDPRLQLRLLWDGLERELVNLFGNRAGFMHERMATGEVEQDARAGIGTMDARQAWGALVAHATKWKEWSDGSDERYEEALVAVYLTAGRGLIPRRGDWLPGTAWDMSDLAPLSVAERCEPAPEDATFTHVCG